MKCGKSLLLLLLLSSPLSAQSFSDDKVYQVKGNQLNQLEKDLMTAKTELANLRAENEQLKTQSITKVSQLQELQTQLQTVSKSFQILQNRTIIEDAAYGIGGLFAGYLIGKLTK